MIPTAARTSVHRMNILELVRQLWRTEPVRAAGYLAALIVFVASYLGIVVDEQGLTNSLLYLVPIILSTEKARGQVTPMATVAAQTVYAVPDVGDLDAGKGRPS